MKATFLSLIPVLVYTGASLAQSWSFTAIADPMENGAPWITALKEVKNQTVNPAPQFSPSKFLTISGDIDPVKDRYGDHKTVFSDASTRPAFLPAIGNHDLESYGKSFLYVRSPGKSYSLRQFTTGTHAQEQWRLRGATSYSEKEQC